MSRTTPVANGLTHDSEMLPCTLLAYLSRRPNETGDLYCYPLQCRAETHEVTGCHV